MILSISNRETALIWNGGVSRKLPLDIQVRARTKLLLIDAANAVAELRVPPSNHLEKLSGNRPGKWSIRINDQWRIYFSFKDAEVGVYGRLVTAAQATNVEIADYH